MHLIIHLIMLPGKDEETAYIIRRGHGITLEEVL